MQNYYNNGEPQPHYLLTQQDLQKSLSKTSLKFKIVLHGTGGTVQDSCRTTVGRIKAALQNVRQRLRFPLCSTYHRRIVWSTQDFVSNRLAFSGFWRYYGEGFLVPSTKELSASKFFIATRLFAFYSHACTSPRPLPEPASLRASPQARGQQGCPCAEHAASAQPIGRRLDPPSPLELAGSSLTPVTRGGGGEGGRGRLRPSDTQAIGQSLGPIHRGSGGGGAA